MSLHSLCHPSFHSSPLFSSPLILLYPKFSLLLSVCLVSGPWTWCWRCATPGPSTGAACRAVSWGSWAPPPRCPYRWRCSRPSRVSRLKLNSFFSFSVLSPHTNVHVSFVLEHLWTEADRHVSQEDVRVRRCGTGLCDLPVYQQRELRLLFFFFSWTLCFINGPNGGTELVTCRKKRVVALLWTVQ